MEQPRLLYEPSDVAALLKIGRTTARRLIDAGALHPVAITPRGVRLCTPDDVERLRVERMRKAS